MAFVDLENAYDNVNRGKLWKALGEYRVLGNFRETKFSFTWKFRE